jgi:hypothetical protein
MSKSGILGIPGEIYIKFVWSLLGFHHKNIEHLFEGNPQALELRYLTLGDLASTAPFLGPVSGSSAEKRALPGMIPSP